MVTSPNAISPDQKERMAKVFLICDDYNNEFAARAPGARAGRCPGLTFDGEQDKDANESLEREH
jgi:hypothetical protein